MKVVVASDAVHQFGSIAVGRELARRWADRGAQVAVVPMAAAGEPIVQALADIGLATASQNNGRCGRTHDALVIVPPGGSGDPWDESSLAAGRALHQALSDPRPLVAIDLTGVQAHDGGAGLLAGLGATSDADLSGGWRGLAAITELDLGPANRALGGCELVGLIPVGDESVPLTSLRGVSSVKGRETGRVLSEIVAADKALSAFAMASGVDGLKPGTGAAWGTGLAILALGGSISTGPAMCARLSGLAGTLSQADLLIGCCESLDIASYGGPVVAELANLAARYQVPFVVGAAQVSIGVRELRSIGIEAAYELDTTTLEAVGRSATGMATTWSW